MANSNPVKIEGLWKEGFALDVHTLSSDYLGDDEFGHAIFRTTRTELGELLYRLRYQGDADVGFMIWDGKSFGTLANVFRLIDQGKKVVVIVSSEETSVTTIRSQGDWNRFVSDCAPDLRERLAKIAQPTTAATSGEKRAGVF